MRERGNLLLWVLALVFGRGSPPLSMLLLGNAIFFGLFFGLGFSVYSSCFPIFLLPIFVLEQMFSIVFTLGTSILWIMTMARFLADPFKRDNHFNQSAVTSYCSTLRRSYMSFSAVMVNKLVVWR